MKNERKLMGLILDGNSDIDVHVWCEIGYLICLRIRFRFQPNCDLIKYFFLFQYKSNIIDIPLLYCTFNKNCKKSYIFEGYEILMFIPDPVSNPSKYWKSDPDPDSFSKPDKFQNTLCLRSLVHFSWYIVCVKMNSTSWTY